MFFSCAKSFVQRFFTDEVHTDSVRHGSFFSNDLVPSLGARINQEIELRRRIISPYNPRYRAWQMWLVVLVIYSAWISPFQFAFLTYKKDGLFVVDNIVNGFFAIDIVLTFFVAYLDSQSCLLIDDPDWKHDQSRCALDQPDKEFCTYTFFEFCPVSANDFRHNEDVLNRQTALHAAVSKGHTEIVKMLLEDGANANNPDDRGWTPKELAAHRGHKSIYDLFVSYENKRSLNALKTDSIEEETAAGTKGVHRKNVENSGADSCCPNSAKATTNATSSISSYLYDVDEKKFTKKRVTIHMKHQDERTSRRWGKLIVLPDSLEELLNIAGEKFGGYTFGKVINAESAEIDDIHVIRDGDHLIFLENHMENT